MIPKTLSPTELRNNLYGVVREVASQGCRYLITPSEGDSVVLCARAEYNALVAERQLLRDLREAEADVVAGRIQTTAAVRTVLARQSAHDRGDGGHPQARPPRNPKNPKGRRTA
jgi:PHD/YefM family antitoxin component YafN of YafNO toxin-antitoxin module